MNHVSISGIENRKYHWNFLHWLFASMDENGIKSIIQIGLDNGYLASLLLMRTAFTDFSYLGVGSPIGLPVVMSYDRNNFFFTDKINNVETVSKVAMFLISNGPSIVICEEMTFGPLFYFPLLKPGDVMVTEGTASGIVMSNVNDIYQIDKWKYYIK